MLTTGGNNMGWLRKFFQPKEQKPTNIITALAKSNGRVELMPKYETYGVR